MRKSLDVQGEKVIPEFHCKSWNVRQDERIQLSSREVLMIQPPSSVG